MDGLSAFIRCKCITTGTSNAGGGCQRKDKVMVGFRFRFVDIGISFERKDEAGKKIGKD